MMNLQFFAILFIISRQVFGAPDGDRLRFSDRRQPEEFEYRTYNRRPYNGGGESNIENVFKIPIAVIKGTAAAAQALSPENTQTIEKIFDIPVTTLDAVGNYIKESRPQRFGNNNDNNNDDDNDDIDDDDIGGQRPLSLSDRRRQEHRERIIRLREQERERRRLAEQERLFHLGHHPSLNFFSSLVDLFSGGGNFFGGHGHHHGHGFHGKPPHRPLKPLKPSKPPNHGGHGGSHGNLPDGNGGYEVNEQSDDSPVHTSGIFSWLQTSNSQSDENRIQNKIAPSSEFRHDRDRAEFRSR